MGRGRPPSCPPHSCPPPPLPLRHALHISFPVLLHLLLRGSHVLPGSPRRLLRSLGLGFLFGNGSLALGFSFLGQAAKPYPLTPASESAPGRLGHPPRAPRTPRHPRHRPLTGPGPGFLRIPEPPPHLPQDPCTGHSLCQGPASHPPTCPRQQPASERPRPAGLPGQPLQCPQPRACAPARPGAPAAGAQEAGEGLVRGPTPVFGESLQEGQAAGGRGLEGPTRDRRAAWGRPRRDGTPYLLVLSRSRGAGGRLFRSRSLVLNFSLGPLPWMPCLRWGCRGLEETKTPSPDPCGSTGQASSRRAEGLRFDSRSGRRPGWWVRSQVGGRTRGSQLMFFALSSPLPFLLSKINT